jgi:hypothetical protein
VEVRPVGLADLGEMERGIIEFASRPNGGLIILPQGLAIVRRDRMMAARSRSHPPATIACAPAVQPQSRLGTHRPLHPQPVASVAACAFDEHEPDRSAGQAGDHRQLRAAWSASPWQAATSSDENGGAMIRSRSAIQGLVRAANQILDR